MSLLHLQRRPIYCAECAGSGYRLGTSVKCQPCAGSGISSYHISRSFGVPTCATCPCYVYRDQPADSLGPARRLHYCAHPAYIESYGIEQFRGETSPVGGPAHRQDPRLLQCPMLEDNSVRALITSALHSAEAWHALHLLGPSLHHGSLLRRDNSTPSSPEK